MPDYIAETSRLTARLADKLDTPVLRAFSGPHRVNLALLDELGELDGNDATAWNCLSHGEQRLLQAAYWLGHAGQAAAEVDDELRSALAEAMVTLGAYLMSSEDATPWIADELADRREQAGF
jgi:hypothetical protein